MKNTLLNVGADAPAPVDCLPVSGINGVSHGKEFGRIRQAIRPNSGSVKSRNDYHVIPVRYGVKAADAFPKGRDAVDRLSVLCVHLCAQHPIGRDGCNDIRTVGYELADAGIERAIVNHVDGVWRAIENLRHTFNFYCYCYDAKVI